MAENRGIHGVSGQRRTAGLRLLPLCLLAGVLAGCQSEASRAKIPAEQPLGDSAAPATQAQAAEASSEASTQQARPQEPVELKVTVLSPKITVAQPLVDLGEVGTDTKHSGKFEFTNTGTAPLKITRVHSCCGVATRGVEAGQTYAPGASGALEFDYFSTSTPVEVKRELVLETNDPDQKLVTLTIKAAVVLRVEHDPARLRLSLKRDNAGCGDITIRSLDGKPFSITSFRSTANAITAQFDPNVKAAEFVLKPRADMEKLQRNLRGQISIDLTHPECGNVRLPYDVLPEFTVNPAHLMLFNLRPDQPIRREIWILSNYRDQFDVESVSSQKGYVKLLGTKKMGNRCQLQIEIIPPAREGEDTVVADMLEVKIKDAETVFVPFRGFYAGIDARP